MFNPVSGVYATARSYNGFGRWALYGLIAVRSADIEKGGSPTDQAEYTDCKTLNILRLIILGIELFMGRAILLGASL